MRMLSCSIAMLIPVAAAAAAERPLARELPPNRAACWERVYDEAHLKAHPRQLVAAVRLVHLPQTWQARTGSFYVQLYFNLRERRAITGYDFQLGGFCKPNGKALRCEPEWDAGTWRIERGPNGTLVVRNGNITVNPNPYDAEEIADNAARVRAKPDDGVWRLSPASGPCEIE